MTEKTYGDRYWCIYAAGNKWIYVHADSLNIGAAGELILMYNAQETAGPVPPLPQAPHTFTVSRPSAVFAPGTWKAIFAASVFDGDPVAIESVHSTPPSWAQEPTEVQKKKTKKKR